MGKLIKKSTPDMAELIANIKPLGKDFKTIEVFGTDSIKKICSEAVLTIFDVYEALEDGFNIVSDIGVVPLVYERVTSISLSLEEAKKEMKELSTVEVIDILESVTATVGQKLKQLDESDSTEDIDSIVTTINDLFSIVYTIKDKLEDGFQISDLEVIASLWQPIMKFVNNIPKVKEEATSLNFIEVASIVGAVVPYVIDLISED